MINLQATEDHMRKADIIIRHYDGHARPVVNVKIHAVRAHGDFDRLLPLVRAQEDGPDAARSEFTMAWIDAHLSDSAGNDLWDMAICQAWEQLQVDIDGERVYPYPVTVYSAGREVGRTLTSSPMTA